MKYICVLSTTPTLKEAKKISSILISQKLAPCVTFIPSVESHYRWKGKVEKSKEVMLFIKTKASLFKELKKILKENHSYEVPEIIALPILKGSASYLRWLAKEVN